MLLNSSGSFVGSVAFSHSPTTRRDSTCRSSTARTPSTLNTSTTLITRYIPPEISGSCSWKLPLREPATRPLLMPDDPIDGLLSEVLWVFHMTDRSWSCELRCRDHGFEAVISAGGQPLIVESFQSRQDAIAWADGERHAIRTRQSS